ncbi:MAG TPA: hypothetical protein VMV69_09360 [Pirellulales bacterium]|nr:hypothetical protein [Pirellulales bacterium]
MKRLRSNISTAINLMRPLRSAFSQPAAVRWQPWLVGAACLSPFAPLLSPDDKVFPYFVWSDYTAYQLPIHEFIRAELLRGELPLWIPWLGNGTPLHANQQAGLFHPLWLGLLALAPANQALKFGLFLHLAAGFAGQYRLARALGVGTLGSSLAAALLIQSGFVVNHLEAGHVNLIVGEALVPWFLFFLHRLLEHPGPRAAASVGLAGALLGLGSHPQISYYTCLTGMGWSAAVVLAAQPLSRRARGFFGSLSPPCWRPRPARRSWRRPSSWRATG